MIKSQVKSKNFRFYFVLCTCYLLLFSLLGCDAFVRKFTRKPKKDKLHKEELVLEPEDYKGSGLSREELYRQNFLYWKTWQDELLNALSPVNPNHKKQIECISEAIKNLKAVRPLLKSEKQAKLDFYLIQLDELKDSISEDFYEVNMARNRFTSERLKKDILKDFSYSGIKNYVLTE